VEVASVGHVEGVPPWALRDPATKQLVRSFAVVGQKVEVDFNGHWTLGTVTDVVKELPSPSPLAADPTETETSSSSAGAMEEDEEDEEDGLGALGLGAQMVEDDDEDDEKEVHGRDTIEITDTVGGLMSFEEFKDSLIRGIEVVKFNRRGKAEFRTLALIGDHTLTWMTPKDAHDYAAAQAAGKASAEQLKSKGNFDVRELLSVRPGEASDPDSKVATDTGTSTLRLYAAKHGDGKEMQATGHCLSLIFPNRSVDIGTDSVAHRDFLLNGFRLLAQRGPSGGKLLTFPLQQRGGLGFSLKAEVKSSGVVQQVLCVADVAAASEAAGLGLKAGDRLYQINGQPQSKWLHSKAFNKKISSLVEHKLSRMAKAKKALVVVVERLDLDKHLAADELATYLKVSKERALVAWLESVSLQKYAIAFVKYGVESVEDLADGKVKKADFTSSKHMGMKKADLKKLNNALEEYKKSAAALADGTAPVEFSNGAEGAEGGGAAAPTISPLARVQSRRGSSMTAGGVQRRGSLEPGAEQGSSRAGVSFGLKGPSGGRLVSITIQTQKLGMVLGNVNDAKGKKRGGVFVVEMQDTSTASESDSVASKGVQLGDRLHCVNGTVLPLSLGHKHVRERLRSAARPLHLILERLNTEGGGGGGAAESGSGFQSGVQLALKASALAAAEEEERDALLDVKTAVLRALESAESNALSASSGAAVRGSMAPVTSGSVSALEVVQSWDESALSMSGWKGLKVETLEGGGRECVVEVDLCSCFDNGVEVDLSCFGPLLRACQHLKVLALSGNPGLKGSLRVFGDGGNKNYCPELRTVYLTNCPNITGEVGMLFGLKGLVTLNLDNCGGVAAALGAVGSATETLDSKALDKAVKAELPKLKVLSLHGLKQQQQQQQAMPQPPTNNPRVTRF